MRLDCSIQHFYAYVKNSHLKQGGEGLTRCVVHAVHNEAGKALTFHVLCDNGAHRSKVPIDKIVWEKYSPEYPLDFLQLWDCFSNDISVEIFDYLSQSRCKVLFKDKSTHYGEYMMTFSWGGGGFVNEPSQWKCMHLVKLDNGCYTLQPNNRCLFYDSSFVDLEKSKESIDWDVDSEEPIAEIGDRWYISDENYYYDVKEGESKE